MTVSSNPNSSSVSGINSQSCYEMGGGNMRRRGGGEREDFQKCDEKFHLFKWSDEGAVEEIEDLKGMVSDVKGGVSDLRAQIAGLEKDCEGMKNVILELGKNMKDCCVVLKI
ncbi:unnamed protein product [Brassica oleracea var. botrytis]|uniref:Uncharacterized protein n=1 Tax=Brassica oleracea TaxID=3712 RepID=A0A3P6BE02_BRAOL|nr:unnamed protein product [Brassica oleracea]